MDLAVVQRWALDYASRPWFGIIAAEAGTLAKRKRRCGTLGCTGRAFGHGSLCADCQARTLARPRDGGRCRAEAEAEAEQGHAWTRDEITEQIHAIVRLATAELAGDFAGDTFGLGLTVDAAEIAREASSTLQRMADNLQTLAHNVRRGERLEVLAGEQLQ